MMSLSFDVLDFLVSRRSLERLRRLEGGDQPEDEVGSSGKHAAESGRLDVRLPEACQRQS